MTSTGVALSSSYDDFQRYLSAKESVDDRALNRNVWQHLYRMVQTRCGDRPLRVLELGAGIGSMARRLWTWDLHEHIHYTGIDLIAANIAQAQHEMNVWTQQQGLKQVVDAGIATYQLGHQQMQVRFLHDDIFHVAASHPKQHRWDLLIAHAFLDLIDIPASLPRFPPLLSEPGLCYFTLTFDGLTLLEPELDPALDAQIQALYHQSMDDRITSGKSAGDSRAGRHLLWQAPQAGINVLSAGASDWVVVPLNGRYPADEAYFLHFIIGTIDRQLRSHPDLPEAAFRRWVSRRHQQIEQGELIYIAHQLDMLGEIDDAHIVA